jgi:hypothetical protein
MWIIKGTKHYTRVLATWMWLQSSKRAQYTLTMHQGAVLVLLSIFKCAVSFPFLTCNECNDKPNAQNTSYLFAPEEA